MNQGPKPLEKFCSLFKKDLWQENHKSAHVSIWSRNILAILLQKGLKTFDNILANLPF